MTDLNKMWETLEKYQPYADADGHGDSWRVMCSERTQEAAWDAAAVAMYAAYADAARAAAEAAAGAARAAAEAAEAAAYADAAFVGTVAAGEAAWAAAEATWVAEAAWAEYWSALAIERIEAAIRERT